MKNLLMSLCVLLSACANLPPSIQNAPSEDIQFGDARNDASQYGGSTVRWGGTIVDVENDENDSWVQVLNYPLKSYGRPNLRKSTEGRFILKTKKFLDPAVYTKGKEITISGILSGKTDRKIGKKTVKMPIVNVNESHLWKNDYNRSGYRQSGYYPYSRGFYSSAFYRRPYFYRRGYYACY